MAIAVLFEFPHSTVEHYDRVLKKMKLGGKLGPGGIFHVVGPMKGGGIRVVDVWKSQEAFDTFFGDPKNKTAMKELPEQPKITIWPVHNILKR